MISRKWNQVIVLNSVKKEDLIEKTGLLLSVKMETSIESGNYKEWWLNGKLHRINGPAIVSLNKNLYAVEGYECFEIKEGNIVMIEGKKFFKSPIEYIEY